MSSPLKTFFSSALPRRKKQGLGGLALDKAGTLCFKREPAAGHAEHEAVVLLRAELMKKMVGTVVSVIESGAFVLLSQAGVGGLLRAGGQRPGAKLKVKVAAIDPAAGKIDLEFAQGKMSGNFSTRRWKGRGWR